MLIRALTLFIVPATVFLPYLVGKIICKLTDKVYPIAWAATVTTWVIGFAFLAGCLVIVYELYRWVAWIIKG